MTLRLIGFFRSTGFSAAQGGMLALLPLLYKHIPHRYTSEIRNVDRPSCCLVESTVRRTQHNRTIHMIFCHIAYTATVFVYLRQDFQFVLANKAAMYFNLCRRCNILRDTLSASPHRKVQLHALRQPVL